MSPNPFRKLVDPRLPAAAAGLSAEGAAVVSLERRRDVLAVRRAGHTQLPEGLLRPHFDDQNVRDAGELAEVVAELTTTTGLARQQRWSVALPENATRTAVVTLESTPGSRAETEEMLRWKTERAVGASESEVRATRERLTPDAQGRARYLVTAVRLSVLEEYESVFAALGWHTGLVLPRHMGEAWWLVRGGLAGADALLVSSHDDGFTALLLRGRQPLMVRNVLCDAEDCADELYRFLLFYRDRMSGANGDGGHGGGTIERLLVTGHGFEAGRAAAVVEETLAAAPRMLRAEDLRLVFHSAELDFAQLAAPAGLAAQKWQ
ncbi:MAG TPA: hypothetical protein VEQ42_09580 [Pyrinomonadaceae bacterium]|nr:hypothetical protein [Pyrinomonadaceae bacterium]